MLPLCQRSATIRRPSNRGKPIGGEIANLPNILKEAMNSLQAEKVMRGADKETDSLRKNSVYELLPSTAVPLGTKIIGSRWEFEVKADYSIQTKAGDAGTVTTAGSGLAVIPFLRQHAEYRMSEWSSRSRPRRIGGCPAARQSRSISRC